MRAISLHQPWASLVALKLKCYETRGWYTNYRGRLVIHAAKRKCSQFILQEKGGLDFLDFANYIPVDKIPYGCVVAIADMTNCIEMTSYTIKNIPALEKAVGDWQPGRYAWKLENIQELDPIPARGKQGLWIPDQDLIQQALSQPLAQAR